MNSQKSPLFLGLLAGLLSFAPLSFAATSATIKLSARTNLTRYCPPVNKLYKNTQNQWGSQDGNFRDFEISLANQLDQFVGAQWQGANLGYVTCVYRPHDPNVFFVTLLFNQLTYEPNTDKTAWTKDQKGSWFNCHSTHPSDCPFLIRPQPKQGNIYDEAARLKEESNPDADTGF